MRTIASMMLALAAVCLWPGPVSAQDRPNPVIKGWGEVIDPRADCTVTSSKGTLTVVVSGAKHDLSVETGDLSAPRVLRDIEVDFIAEVKVGGNVQPSGRSLSERYLAYHGAGWLVWVDDQSYVRLERAATLQDDGKVTHYVNFELRRNGKVAASNMMGSSDRDIFLRIERHGEMLVASASEDGVRWTPFNPLVTELPRKVKLGVTAVNTASDSFRATFSDAGVFKREPGLTAK